MAALLLVTPACSGDNQDAGPGGSATSASTSQAPATTSASTPTPSSTTSGTLNQPVKVSPKQGDISPLVKKDGKIKCGPNTPADAKLIVDQPVPYLDGEVAVTREGHIVTVTMTPSNPSVNSGIINGKVPFVLKADDGLLPSTFYFDENEVGKVESVTICGGP